MILIMLFLFLTSLFPEVVILDLALELRPLLFPFLVCLLVLKVSMMNWHIDRLTKKQKLSAFSFDATYAICVGLAIISFLFASKNIKAFHCVFAIGGMFLVYIFIRAMSQCSEEENSNLVKSPLPPFQKGLFFCLMVVLIGFTNALIGVIQFFGGSAIIGTFGYSSFYGCFLAMNVPVSLGVWLAMREESKASIRCSATACEGRYRVFGIQFLKLFSLLAFLVILGVTVSTKSRSAIIALAVVLPLMMISRFKGWKVERFKGKHPSKSHQHTPVSAKVVWFVKTRNSFV